MKSHDCHVFMQKLLTSALRELLSDDINKVLCDLSNFFKDLCSTTLLESNLRQMEKNIAGIICTLETKFFPAMFDPMEHLPVHLPEECRLGGPVSQWWMYNIERLQRKMKQKVGNKARVEGSIAEKYVHEELTHFCSMYFESEVETSHNLLGRNVVDDRSCDPNKLEACTYPERYVSLCLKKCLDPKKTQIHSWIEAVGGVRKNKIPGLPRVRASDVYESEGCPPRPRKGEGSSGMSALARLQDDMFMRVVDDTLAQARANPEEYMLTPEQIRLLARDVVEGDSSLPSDHPIARETRHAIIGVVIDVLNNIYKTDGPGAAKGKAPATDNDDLDDGGGRDDNTDSDNDHDMSAPYYDIVSHGGPVIRD